LRKFRAALAFPRDLDARGQKEETEIDRTFCIERDLHDVGNGRVRRCVDIVLMA
jgi:hypothetical protein